MTQGKQKKREALQADTSSLVKANNGMNHPPRSLVTTRPEIGTFALQVQSRADVDALGSAHCTEPTVAAKSLGTLIFCDVFLNPWTENRAILAVNISAPAPIFII